MQCLYVFLVDRGFFYSISNEIPDYAIVLNNVLQDKILVFYPKNKQVVPTSILRHQVIFLWDTVKKMVASLTDYGWRITNIKTIPEYNNLVEDLKNNLEQKSLLSVIEKRFEQHLGWNDKFPDISYYLAIAMEHPSGQLRIEIRFASTMCLSSFLFGKPFFEQTIKTVIKILEED